MSFKYLSQVIFGVLLYGLTVAVYSAPNLVAGATSGNAGNTVSIPVAFTNNAADDVVAMDFELKYDPAVLSVNSVNRTVLGGSVSNHANNAAGGIITFVIANFPSQAIPNGNIIVTFAINATASVGATTVGLQNVTFSNSAAGAIAPDNISNGQVNIIIPSVQSAPTLSQWALILLALTLLLTPALMRRFHH